MKKSYVMLILALCLVPILASAALVRVGEEISIAQETITDDVYAAAGNVSSGATVSGDLIAAGGNVFISGSTTEDVIVAGGSISIVGEVGDDLRAAGGNVAVSGSIVDDVVIAGGQLNLVSGSEVGGDLIAAGGRIVLDGTIGGNVRAAAADVVINGTVNGNLHIRADRVTVGERAAINGRLVYASPTEADIKPGSQIAGGVEYNKIMGGGRTAAAASVGLLFQLLSLFVAALVIQWIFKNMTVRMVQDASDRVWMNLSLGFVVLVVTPIAAIILMVTVIGIPFGIILLLGYVAMLIFSYIFLPVFLGSIAWKMFNRSQELVLNWKTALIGAFITTLIWIIPVIGGIFLFLAMLVIIGAIVVLKKQHIQRFREGGLV